MNLNRLLPKTVKEKIEEENEFTWFECGSCSTRNCTECSQNHHFYVSSVGDCSRKIAFNWLYGQKPIEDPKLKRLAFEGELIHLIVLNLALKRKAVLEIEKRFEYEIDGLKFSFRPDAILEDGVFDLKTIKDIKSIKAVRFKDFRQVNLYMAFLGFQFAEIMYIERNLFENIFANKYADIESLVLNAIKKSKTFVVELDKKQAAKDVLFFKNIFDNIMKNKIPKGVVSKWCETCQWKKECFKLTNK